MPVPRHILFDICPFSQAALVSDLKVHAAGAIEQALDSNTNHGTKAMIFRSVPPHYYASQSSISKTHGGPRGQSHSVKKAYIPF